MFRRSRTFTSARLQKRRRKVIIGKIVAALFCAGGLWAVAFWLSGLPAITIRGIEVGGNVSLSAQDIASRTEHFLVGRYFFTVPRANIFFYPKAAVTKNILESFPRVENADIRFKNFHTISITIAEREAAALWCQALNVQGTPSGKHFEECYLMDKDGFLFDAFNPEPPSRDAETLAVSNHYPAVIKFYGGLSAANPVGHSYETAERFHSLLAFAQNIGQIGVAVLAFRERSDKDLEVEVLGGARLVLGRDANLVSVAANLETIVSDPSFGGTEGFKKVDYVDLRFGNKVFYRLK